MRAIEQRTKALEGGILRVRSETEQLRYRLMLSEAVALVMEQLRLG